MRTDPSIFDDLRSIQSRHGYIPAAELDALSRSRSLPLYHLHGLASFYPHFRLAPPPRVEVRICDDMSCHLRGACELRAALGAAFGKLGKEDLEIGDVSCLGRCDSAPALVINERIYSGLTTREAEACIVQALAGVPAPALPPRPRRADRLAADPYGEGERYAVLRQLVARRDWDGVLTTIEASGLAGLGGAGFPTGLKWRTVRSAPGDEKYVVCNADESEPGTIKDRFLLERAPHLLIEAMIIAGLVVGARRGILYIRHEYDEQGTILEDEIERCRQSGLLGRSVLGSDLAFELELFVSPGGYICGEESALLEALEGKRAEPRNKPPFPATHGLWNKPTVINNVETLINIPLILARGVDAFRELGRGGSAGVKFVGVSGHVERPGVFEVPMGTTYAELISEHAGGITGGRALKAFAPSGPSSGYLPATLAGLPLDARKMREAGSMLGSAAVVVCAEGTCMLDMALNAVRFFRNESCGKCVPCRVGSQKMVDLLGDWARGRGAAHDLATLEDLTETMKLASICGLGQFAPAPITSVLAHFRDEIDDHWTRQRCPSGICFEKDAAS